MALLRPLLLDVESEIQQTAALALGRLANYNEDLAEAVVKGDILPQLVYSLAEQNVIAPIIIVRWGGGGETESPWESFKGMTSPLCSVPDNFQNQRVNDEF